MIKRLFIANRGEIALRIIRTANRLGITTILGASQADKDSLPAQQADEVAIVGPAASSESYLNVEKVIAAAKSARADAIHPGYGFLSENAEFAQSALDAGILFVGPDVSSLHAMGDKLMARKVGIEAGLPVVPGGEANDKTAALSRAIETGFPVLLKAVSGGGGKGMRRVDTPAQLSAEIDAAMAEAQASFGDPRIYVERFIASGRHVEVQVLGDGKSAIHLGTRDCSIQRRFQKLVEEAPAPAMLDEARAAIEHAAVRLTRHLNYRGAGTVEFLVDADNFEFYFLEMNARIQVEHPVTEAITGIDLIEQQLLIAEGLPLSLCQEDMQFTGHAIEVRINAEDPDADFRPNPGKVTRAAWPAGKGIRVDSHIASGSVIAPFYDSLIGKIIVHANTREQAIEQMEQALSNMRIEGITTTASLHQKIMRNADFRAGGVDTRFFGSFQP